MSEPVVVRTPTGEVVHAAAAYFATDETGGALEVFRDDLSVIRRYEAGEWLSAFLEGSKL